MKGIEIICEDQNIFLSEQFQSSILDRKILCYKNEYDDNLKTVIGVINKIYKYENSLHADLNFINEFKNLEIMESKNFILYSIINNKEFKGFLIDFLKT